MLEDSEILLQSGGVGCSAVWRMAAADERAGDEGRFFIAGRSLPVDVEGRDTVEEAAAMGRDAAAWSSSLVAEEPSAAVAQLITSPSSSPQPTVPAPVT